MALSYDEINHAYNVLTQAATRHGLNWVVGQVEAQIALGKIKTSKIRASEVPQKDTPDELAIQMKRGRPSKFVVSEQYPPEERLRILIEALRHAVRGVWEEAVAVHDFMHRNIGNLGSIKFMPEDISKEAFTIDKHELLQRNDSVIRFSELLAELEGEI